MKRALLVALASVVLTTSLAILYAQATRSEEKPDRDKALTLMRQGNYKEAAAIFSKLATDPADDPRKVSDDLNNLVANLQNLGDYDQIEDLREKTVAAHGSNWRLLMTAGQSYLNAPHYGYIVAGEFHRATHRGAAKYVGTYERDRVRALQLVQQAMGKTAGEEDKTALGSFYLACANMMLGNRGYAEAWRLQYLTDLTKLPDYDEGGYYGYGYGGGRRGAPVNPDGSPVLYYLPKGWKDATNDGERWRWALMQASEVDPKRSAETRFIFATFLRDQFGVQTMAEYGWFFGRGGTSDDDTRKDESGSYAVHTLTDQETIAKLATGIKRFKLEPAEFNYVKIFKELAGEPNSHQDQSTTALAENYENRRQYPKAAEVWKAALQRFGPGPNQWRQKRLDQIVENWGQFQPMVTQAAGGGAVVDFRYRNANKVSFEAHEIDIPKLLADLKDYLKSGPKQLEWQKLDISNMGYRLVEKNETQYLKSKVAAWDLELKPRPNHFDSVVTVATPLQKPGAYWLVAKVPNGNVSRIVLWVADTAIVKKPLDKGNYYFVADAVTGAPIAKANLEFFGYRQQWVNDQPRGAGHYDISTADAAEFTDADGQCVTTAKQQDPQYSWIIIATTPEPKARLAYLGFTGVWYGNYYDAEYKADKVFVITDRPVYRPGGPVKFKFWANRAQYDQEGKSPFAGQQFLVQVNNPKGEKVFEKTFTADEYGGFDGEFALEKEATLGVYQIFLPGPGAGPVVRPVPGRPGMVEAVRSTGVPPVSGGTKATGETPVLPLAGVVNPCTGGGNFRVEEYKKPEFEVKVDAPSEPVMLGEKIAAKIQAKYYFGAPVTEAKVKYKIMRSEHTARWYPICYWDWFYGSGYWWFAYDYNWYPGWREWGCMRPVPWWWWGGRRQQPPELVAEVETNVDKDGTVKVEIDTALAKLIHGDVDHKYEITAEVTDQSRRTIVGVGSVLVARKPFKVYAWVTRGHYRVGDVIQSHFKAQTLDNKPVQGKGQLQLLKVSYKDAKDGSSEKGPQPVETEVQNWTLPTDVEGAARQQIKASEPGQYRLSYKVTDAKGHTLEGGYVFCIGGFLGKGFDDNQFRFNDIELVTDSQEYKPQDKVNLMVNTNRPNSTVLLFVRPANGIYLAPKVLRLKGKSATEAVEVVKKDMPNFFIEGVTVSGGKVFSEMREVVVPPEKRVLNVEVKGRASDVGLRASGAASGPSVVPEARSLKPEASPPAFKPGQKAKFDIKLTDPTGEPYSGSTVVAIYDKSVEYISGGSNVPEIKEFFWKWRRRHNPSGQSSLDKGGYNVLGPKEIAMGFIGIFGQLVLEELDEPTGARLAEGGRGGGGKGLFGGQNALQDGAAKSASAAPPAPGMARPEAEYAKRESLDRNGELRAGEGGPAGGGQPAVEPTVRTQFADTALWVGALKTDSGGMATVELTMPENLTTWKARVWAMGSGAKCGQGDTEVVTTKNLLVRLQAPRFFVQKDEVVLSANVHNYLKTKKSARVVLELEGGCLDPILPVARNLVTPKEVVKSPEGQIVDIEPNGQVRVDWRVKAVKPGQAVVRMKALTDEESDAMEMKFPVFIHGMLKTESFCGVIRPDKDSAEIALKVPAERLPEQSRLEIRYSPTLAGAMVDALPYLVDYPYETSDISLNRFLPTVITQKVLLKLGVDLKDIEKKRTNLNAQEIGDDQKRAGDWAYRGGYMSRGTATVKNPVFSEDEVRSMVKAGLNRLTSMQCADGGWGWFGGWGERSWPHTTAVVVHGLQIARDNDVAIVPGVLERGVAWLKSYQAEQLRRLKLPQDARDHKDKADNLDAMVYMVLVDEKADNNEMREFLYRDRNDLAVYAKAMFALACHKVGDAEKRDMLRRNIEQFLKQVDENQTAYLQLPQNNWWWCWYGSETEADAYYLKLLCAVEPKNQTASRLVKYLLNNRKHATYWNSTRDTAVVVEAFADYLKASGEDKPDMTVEIALDGKKAKEVKINAENLFSFDNKLVLEGKDVTDGPHKVTVNRKGAGSVYFNAYLTNFTLEDPIAKAGLEIKVQRKFYKLVEVDKSVKVEGVRGQAVDQKVQKYERRPLKNLDGLKSGDLVEIELEIESLNDYEYIMFEDMKASGFETVEVRSGYNGNDLGAYMELRDERVTFFVRQLARGKSSVSYRMRAEIPGRFSALPTKASAMYAPELKANSDEFKVNISD